MPRSSRGSSAPRSSAPSRPVAQAPSRPAQPPQQRPMSTTAYPPARTGQAPPPAAQAPPAAQGQSPGLFGQMASTAAGVAVGSSIGHAIGGLFGGYGGGQAAPAETQQPQEQQYSQPVDSYAQPGGAMDSGLYNSSSSAREQAANGPCAGNVKQFADCMNQNYGSVSACSYWHEQMMSCLQATKNY